jgi:hypothetical protein
MRHGHNLRLQRFGAFLNIQRHDILRSGCCPHAKLWQSNRTQAGLYALREKLIALSGESARR